MANETGRRRRLFFIDNLRIVLITLVVLWHTAITYGAAGFWPYQESQADDLTSLVFTLFSAVNGPYVLGFFFLIAGYFTPRSYDRKGLGPFLKDRLLRLGIPLLFYILVFDPLILYAIGVNTRGYNESFWEYLSHHFDGYRGLGVGPLWFAEALLMFTIGYGLYRRLVKPVAEFSQRNEAPPSHVATASFAAIVGVATFILRLWLPMGWIYQPLGLPLPLFPQYIGLFVIGIIAYRRNWLLEIPGTMGRLWTYVAIFFIIVLFPLVFALGGALEGNTGAFMGGAHWQSLAYSVWEQFVCVGMIMGLLVCFRKRFDHQGTLARAMAASTYTVYFVHAPVLVLLTLFLRDVDLHALLKWAVVGPLAAAVCFLVAYFVRRLPLARRIL